MIAGNMFIEASIYSHKDGRQDANKPLTQRNNLNYLPHVVDAARIGEENESAYLECQYISDYRMSHHRKVDDR